MEIKTRSGCVSCIADCRTCGWTYENQKNGLAIAKKHALKWYRSDLVDKEYSE